MRVALNLASRPYVELGPIYRRLRVLIAALALLAVPLWFLVRAEKQKADVAHARLIAVQQDTTTLEREEQGYESDMRQPENAAVLRQSQFLNQLFQAKAFSWTAVMMDLENILPAGVQVENIDPIISRSGNVTIHLRVNGQHDRAVELVRNLEHSHRFLLPRLAGETAETQQSGRGMQQAGFTGVNFDILADYNPLPVPSGKAPAKSGVKSEAKGTAKTTAKTRTHRHASAGRTKKLKPGFPVPQKAGPR